MALKKNHVSPIFKKLKIELDCTNPNQDSELLRRSENSVSDLLSNETLSLNSLTDPDSFFNRDAKPEPGTLVKTEIIQDQTEFSSISKKNTIPEKEKDLSSNLTGYSRIQEFKMVKIGIASSEQMINWAEKLLPNGKIFGEVLNPNTLHYKTFKPQKGGLFCQRIFGPLKDFECACGIVRKPSSEETLVQSLVQERNVGGGKRTYCSVCDVEYTWSVIRRYQLGYIRLASPVTHLWYLKANPSYLSMLLDVRKKDLEDIIYCTQIVTLEDYWRPLRGAPMTLSPTLFFESYKKYLTASNENLSLDESWNRFKKKQEIEKQKRKKVQPRRRTISYFNSKTHTSNAQGEEPLIFPSLALRSKKDQIESLETAYRLSTDDYETRHFSRLTYVAQIFIQKKMNRIKKDIFLQARNFNVEEYYKQNFKTFIKKSFLTNRHFFQQNTESTKKHLMSIFKIDVESARNNQINKNFRNKPKNHIFKEVLKNHLNTRPQSHSKEDLFNMLTKLMVLRWGPGNSYRYTKSRKNAVIFDSKIDSKSQNSLKVGTNFGLKSDNSMTLIENEDFKNRFLTVFFNFIRKAKLQKNWDSIYYHPFEATFTFSNFRKNLNVPMFLFPTSLELKFLDNILLNSVILYFLFILQSSKLEVFISKFLLSQKQSLVQFVLTNSNKFFISLSKKHIHSLKDLLNEDLISKQKRIEIFIEIESALQNKNLNTFGFLTFQLLLKSFLIQQVRQKHSFHKKKTFQIFLIQKTNQEELSQIQAKFAFNRKSVKFSKIKKKNLKNWHIDFKKNLEQLVRKKQILSFVNNNQNSLNETRGYLKSVSELQKKLQKFKYQRLSPAFQLFNNISTTSYLETWQTEKDWKYFLYYNKALVDDPDQLLPTYRYRFPTFADESRSRLRHTTFLNPQTSTSNEKAFPILGANLLEKLLFQYEGLELKKMAKQHQNVVPKFNRYIRFRKQKAIRKSDYTEVQKLLQTRDDLIRRLKLLRKFFKKNTKTSSMILNTIPVLPPDLRPILKMQNQIAASDLNRFYQRILYRNDRLRKFLRSNAAMMNTEPAFEVKYAQRLLQEAVDNLIQNGKGQVKPETNSRGQPLKSLSEILKGKQGRFRQYLLGKRVDYSGRSVIVVGPTLKIYECGLPFEMAIELFLPFLIKRIFQYDLARTVMGAKTLLKKNHHTTWHLLEEIMQHHPILLNRAPTLHRLGIQAFRPKLITGRAILLHPLVCPAFNADFDGDQMAVHLPITVEARTEAWKLMFSRNHLISPATGEPILLPTQDMVLGCYYLTTTSPQDQKENFHYPFGSVTCFYFSSMKEILQAYLQEKIHLQTPIWMRWNGLLQSDPTSSGPYEIRILPNGSWIEIQSEYHRQWTSNGQWNHMFVRTTPGRILFNLLIQGCIEKKL